MSPIKIESGGHRHIVSDYRQLQCPLGEKAKLIIDRGRITVLDEYNKKKPETVIDLDKGEDKEVCFTFVPTQKMLERKAMFFDIVPLASDNENIIIRKIKSLLPQPDNSMKLTRVEPNKKYKARIKFSRF